MKQYAKPLNKLINELSKLPGIGGKTAQRLAFHILSIDDAGAFALSDAIKEAKEKMEFCSVCGNLTDTDPCVMCREPAREWAVNAAPKQPMRPAMSGRTTSRPVS